MATHLDLLLTLLHWGAAGWRAALEAREALHPYLVERLTQVAQQQGERLLVTPDNPISVALTLDALQAGLRGENMLPSPAKGADSMAGNAQASAPDAAAPAGAAAAAAGAAGEAAGAGGAGSSSGAGADAVGKGGSSTVAGASASAAGSSRRPLDITFFGSMLWAR